MRKPFLRANAFIGSLERNTSPPRCLAPMLLARHSMSAMSSVPSPYSRARVLFFVRSSLIYILAPRVTSINASNGGVFL